MYIRRSSPTFSLEIQLGILQYIINPRPPTPNPAIHVVSTKNASADNQTSLNEATLTRPIVSRYKGVEDMNSDERWDIATILKSGWLKGCQEMLEEISEQWKL